MYIRFVGSWKLRVSFAKEPYKRDYILQKRPIILRSLLIAATPHAIDFKEAANGSQAIVMGIDAFDRVIHILMASDASHTEIDILMGTHAFDTEIDIVTLDGSRGTDDREIDIVMGIDTFDREICGT